MPYQLDVAGSPKWLNADCQWPNQFYLTYLIFLAWISTIAQSNKQTLLLERYLNYGTLGRNSTNNSFKNSWTENLSGKPIPIATREF
jgi:hypothetical protein